MLTTETPRKDDDDPPLEPRGDNASIEAVGETGTTDAPTADDTPTGNMNKGKQGRSRKVVVGKNRPTRKTKKSSVAKPRQIRVLESSDNEDFVAKDGSDVASDGEESNKRGRQSNGGKKAGSHDTSSKTNNGQKKSEDEQKKSGKEADVCKFEVKDASDDASDEDKSSKRRQKSNGGKKAGADNSSKTK
jgi:hypothetical protein